MICICREISGENHDDLVSNCSLPAVLARIHTLAFATVVCFVVSMIRSGRSGRELGTGF